MAAGVKELAGNAVGATRFQDVESLFAATSHRLKAQGIAACRWMEGRIVLRVLLRQPAPLRPCVGMVRDAV